MITSKAFRRGFTLVEVMIVVAVVGILAVLGIYGVRRYLSSAKSAEAKQIIGNISRAAHGSFEREGVDSENMPEGSLAQEIMHQLCGSAAPVPANVPAGTKYQPSTADGTDFHTGTVTDGWKCLRFNLDEPTYYQFQYNLGASTAAPLNPASCAAAECYEAAALGDLNANGLFSRFARTGTVNVGTGALKVATAIYVENQSE